ncbi:MAG TPA: hypothetical protein VKF17_06445 [Isosphaeraceae bacterium]|nr:hypothetical protein [Isosphaeraceae bacterium]
MPNALSCPHEPSAERQKGENDLAVVKSLAIFANTNFPEKAKQRNIKTRQRGFREP